MKKLLESAFGNRWGVEVSSDVSRTVDSRDEQFAYIWNKQRVKLVETKMSREKRVFQPHAINAYNREINVDESQFVRIPYYARFEPVGSGYFEFRLVNVHLYFGSNSTSEIERRQQEYKVLTQEVFPKISANRYGNNKQAITVVMGDYNLNIEKPRGEAEKRINKQTYIATVYEYQDGRTYQRIETVQDELTTLKNPETDENVEKDDNPNRGYSQNYDHFTIDTNYMKEQGISCNYRRIDAVRKYYGDDFEAYRRLISDHVPIVIDINFDNCSRWKSNYDGSVLDILNKEDKDMSNKNFWGR